MRAQPCRGNLHQFHTNRCLHLRSISAKGTASKPATEGAADLEKTYWSGISQKVETLKQRLESTDEQPTAASADPRPYPSSPEALIWIGMSVWEVMVRSNFVEVKAETFLEMYEICENYTSMQTMSRVAMFLVERRLLTVDEVTVMFWGITCGDAAVPEYNEVRAADNRRKLNKTEGESLKSAIAFQCLAGYLQMTDQKRLDEICQAALDPQKFNPYEKRAFDDLQQLLKSKL